MNEAYITGFGVGAGLILAIGSQNAFVLRQGIRREHVMSVCFVCAISDAMLILFGVTSFQKIVQYMAWIEPIFLYLGAAFLFLYGAKSFYAAAFSNEALAPSAENATSLISTLGVCLAFTWLNPHVYLDTVFLLGSISTRFPDNELIFGMGAVTASFVWFFMLGYGASLLRPLFTKVIAWRILDVFVGLVMWIIAIKLLLKA